MGIERFYKIFTSQRLILHFAGWGVANKSFLKRVWERLFFKKVFPAIHLRFFPRSICAFSCDPCLSLHNGNGAILKKGEPFGYFTKRFMKKKSGIELLSRTLVYSTIVAGPLIDRVRDGNVSIKPAIDTGKKGKSKISEKRIKSYQTRIRDEKQLELKLFKFREFTHACFLSANQISWQRSYWKKGGQASRPVSNTKLKALLLVHLYPIKLVVFKRSSGE